MKKSEIEKLSEVLNDCKNQLEKDKEIFENHIKLPRTAEYIEKGILPEIEKALIILNKIYKTL